MAARMGFVPSRTLHGGPFLSNVYPVSAAPADSFFIGDVVCRVAGGTDNGGCVAYTTAREANILGVVKACYDADKRPRTHSQPTRGPYIQATAGGRHYVDVYDDPAIIYKVRCENSAGASNIGGFLHFLPVTAASQGNTATGISRQSLTVFTAAGTPFRIIGFAPDEVTEVGGSANALEVLIAPHRYNPGPAT